MVGRQNSKKPREGAPSKLPRLTFAGFPGDLFNSAAFAGIARRLIDGTDATARAGFGGGPSYRGAAKVRRRMRGLVRSRVFNNARTAPRNLDLLPAISAPILFPNSSYCRWIPASAQRPQCGLFSRSASGLLLLIPRALPCAKSGTDVFSNFIVKYLIHLVQLGGLEPPTS